MCKILVLLAIACYSSQMSMASLHDKKVKIVATLGPASDSPEMILRLAEAGADVFRINCSHATPEESAARIHSIRRAEKKIGRPLAVMGDLAGPKIRIGKVKPGTVLEPGKEILISARPCEGSAERFSVHPPEILAGLIRGAAIYLGDGAIKLEIQSAGAKEVRARVIVGGQIRSHIGFSAEGLSARFSLSAKDKRDIQSMIALGADALAVSFVQHERDIQAVRALLPRQKQPFLIAKIETRQGVLRAEHILKEADGLMVARGDLGLALEKIEELPLVQKDLIAIALAASKPVITATQMLGSMTASILPARAEITDVANAILDGTDAIMLSEETARGAFPLEAVRVMAKIARTVSHRVGARTYQEDGDTANAISASLQSIARHTHAQLIIAFTESGATARRIAKHKPSQPIIALSPRPATVRALNFSWGVSAICVKTIGTFDGLLKKAKHIAGNNTVCALKKGELFVVSAGVPFGETGSTNLIVVEKA